MAIVKNIITDEISVLYPQHLFGRNQQLSHTYIEALDISQSHATVFWKDDYWYLKDHSRNGTVINGKFLNQNSTKLQIEDVIQFGKDPSTKWQLIEYLPPSCYLKSLNYTNKILILDKDTYSKNQKINSFLTYKNTSWYHLLNNELIPLTHHTQLTFDNDTWLYIENQPVHETIDHGYILKQAFYQFSLSIDEEHISLKIISKDLVIDLGARIYNYLLLALVRRRIQDHQDGYAASDIGWISIEELSYELSKELNKDIDAYYINLQIYRIRKHIAQFEPYGYLFANVIERKSGFVRFSHPFFKIIKEDQAIAEFLF